MKDENFNFDNQILEEEESPRSAFKKARDRSLKELGEGFASQDMSDNRSKSRS